MRFAPTVCPVLKKVYRLRNNPDIDLQFRPIPFIIYFFSVLFSDHCSYAVLQQQIYFLLQRCNESKRENDIKKPDVPAYILPQKDWDSFL